MKKHLRLVARIATTILTLWSLAGVVRAQEPEAAPAAQADREAVETAPVLVDGETLFRVRGISARPAGVRADAIAGRIRDLARDPSLPLEELVVRSADARSEIVAGSRLLMSVSDADAALEGVDRTAVAETYADRIRQAVETYRRDRSTRHLTRAIAYALVASLLFALALWLLRLFFRWLVAHLDARYHARIRSFQLRSFTVLHAEQAWKLLAGTLRGLHLVALLLVLYAYLDFVLVLFPWTRWLARNLLSYVWDPFSSLVLATILYVPKLAFLVILTLIVRYLLKLARLFFAGVEAGTVVLGKFEPEWANPTYKILRLVVFAFALIVAYPYLPGAESAAFKGLSLFLGVVLSLGSSSAISNIVAGYSITYRRAFRLGDRIKIGDHSGEVVETRLLVTHLRTPKNEEVVVPNSEILSRSVTNFSSLARKGGVILHTSVGIGYETPWRQVEAMLLLAAARTLGTLREPPPFVLQTALADFAVTYQLNVHTDRPLVMEETYADLHRNILDVFNEYGVQIMTPAYERDPEQPKIVPREQWHAPPAPPAPEEPAR